MAAIGDFDKDWFALIRSKPQGVVMLGKDVFAWKASQTSDYAAYTRMPSSVVEEQLKRTLWTLVPGGVFAGALLAWAVLAFVRLQTSIPAMIKVALRRKEFYLLFQPVVDMRTSEWVGAEALLRWKRPNGEMIGPDIFIPAAEKAGLIGQVTQHVLELLAPDIRALCSERPDFFVAVNFSAADFCDPSMIKRVEDLITATRILPMNIHVEATERVFLDTHAAQENVMRLHKMGVQVSIDDFGTGYSSLSCLQDMDLDCLKIDKCFVSSVGTGAVTRNVVGHIIEMAKSLRLKIIAEGVETEEQARHLRAQGVAMAQGWLYSKAISAKDMLLHLQGTNATSTVPHSRS